MDEEVAVVTRRPLFDCEAENITIEVALGAFLGAGTFSFDGLRPTRVLVVHNRVELDYAIVSAKSLWLEKIAPGPKKTQVLS